MKVFEEEEKGNKGGPELPLGRPLASKWMDQKPMEQVGTSEAGMKIKITISFSGRTSLKQVESISNWEKMKQFSGYAFPGDPAIFLSLLTNYASHGDGGWEGVGERKITQKKQTSKEWFKFVEWKSKLISRQSNAGRKRS